MRCPGGAIVGSPDAGFRGCGVTVGAMTAEMTTVTTAATNMATKTKIGVQKRQGERKRHEKVSE